MNSKPIILWYRNDLRIGDHPALAATAKSGRPVLPVYVLDDDTQGDWRPGGASRWWLHHSLTALSAQLGRFGCRLILRRGEAVKIIADIAAEAGAKAVYCSRGFEPWALTQESSLSQRLAEHGIGFDRFSATLLHDPDQLCTKAGRAFKVYTPFWRALSATLIRRPHKAPRALRGVQIDIASETLDEWRLLPHDPDWSGGLRKAWQPGERTAQVRLKRFLQQHAAHYGTLRDRPDLAATSRLSPHLHFGEISPVQCWHAALAQEAADPSSATSLEVFRKELVWREFAYHLLYHWPATPNRPMRSQFDRFPWKPDPRLLASWQSGWTGYPIVDAGMRELWHTGWMHNRVRMIVASFLTKHLLQNWQAGEAWFWDCLVDADLAANSASWQWVAGCGADAAPYFRIFNPILQGEKFDPDGTYVRRWIPELADLPTKYIFAPWSAPEPVLQAGGVKLGVTYPKPIVDHKTARSKALAAYEEMTKS
ncbi:MAG: cryptochrome/photolyase family protein [Hyphomicrobiaceae bacterium]